LGLDGGTILKDAIIIGQHHANHWDTAMTKDADGGPIHNRTVLLVDDEKMVLEVGQAILQRLGHAVITADSGEAAVDQLRQQGNAIGCVVLDLSMPGIDGKETFKQLRELSPDLPVIIASGLSADHVAGQFEGLPRTAVIQKPYQVANLSATIQELFSEPSGPKA
jgi:CheY-like chemotaxis protein